MSNDHWTDRLSEYLDGELDGTDVAGLEQHLAGCGACRATLEELRQVVTVAAALPDREPAADLLPGILERIREGDDVVVVPLRGPVRSTRRFTFSLPQLAAAAVAIMTLSAGAAWFAARPAGPAPAVGVTEPVGGSMTADPASSPGPQDEMAASFVSDTQLGYDVAIDRLERQLDDRRDQLDPETIEVIERNLALIDTAIAEARQALENDPSNAYLYRHLDRTLGKKVDLLRRATRRTAL